MKLVVVVSVLSLAACAGGKPGGLDPDPDPSGADAGAGTDGADVLANADEDLFRDILAGNAAADIALVTIAQRGGFPIRTRAGGYIIATLESDGPFSLAGDHDSWQGAPMSVDAGMHWIELDISAPDGSLYKLVNGAGEYRADPFARRYGFDEFGEYSLVEASAPHRERWPRVSPSAGGLPTRTVRAWVPAGGIASATRHIYVHDGQNLFSPTAPFGGWRLHETAPAGVLVIGIDNTPERMSEYTPTSDSLGGGPIGGLGDAYADFVAADIIPMIETSAGVPDVRGVMGSSLGGLIAFHQALRDPSLFRFVASLSGTFGWGSIGVAGETTIHRFAAAAKLPATLYLDSGGSDGGGCVDGDGDGVNDDSSDSDNYCVNRQLADLLAARGYTFGDDLHHHYEPNAAHNEAAWAARVPAVMSLFMGVAP